MTTLYLSYNQIGDTGAVALAEGLKHNGAMTKLYLSYNEIGDDGASAIAEGLKHNGALKELRLDRHNTENGLFSFLRATSTTMQTTMAPMDSIHVVT